jgi:hypothetical protein
VQKGNLIFKGAHAAYLTSLPDGTSLFDGLRDEGWEIDFTSTGGRALLSIDTGPAATRNFKNSALTRNQCFLITHEPRVVWPWNFSEKHRRPFGHIIELGRETNIIDGPWVWPVVWPSGWREVWPNKRASRALMISSDRISFHKGELYSLRRQVVHNNVNVDLAGRAWNSSRAYKALRVLKELSIYLRLPTKISKSALSRYFRVIPRYLGPVKSKIELSSNYKVAVVIENSEEYMSEKLLEAMISGCIPVYVGPDTEIFGIPRNLVIKASPNLNSVEEAIETALLLDHSEWAQKFLAWVIEAHAETNYSHAAFWRKLIVRISASQQSLIPPQSSDEESK